MYVRVTRKRLACVVALLVAVAATGVAYAAIPSDANVFNGCMLKATGTVRLIDPTLPSTSLLSHCVAIEQAISWNQKGQQGAPGTPGAQGAPGKDGTNGADGATGATGPMGATGATGSQGAKGDTGSIGATGPQGPQGETGAAGSGGVSNYSIQQSGLHSLGGLGSFTATESCPAGTHVLGGGAMAPIHDVNIVDSYPSNGGTSWSASGYNPGLGPASFFVFAICAST